MERDDTGGVAREHAVSMPFVILRYSKLDASPDPQVFIPYRHYSRGFARFTAVIRMRDDPLSAADEIRAHPNSPSSARPRIGRTRGRHG